MNPAYYFLESLRAAYPENWRVDWEAVLERSYRIFVGKKRNILDIGGHRGRHADIFIVDLESTNVVVFEPLVTQCTELQRRFAAYSNVRVINAAVGREDGTSRFVINRNAPEESGFRRRKYNNEASAEIEETQVAVVSLDSLDLGFKVDYIKIDVEGGEIDVLEGARGVLARDRPILSVEYGYSSYSVYGHRAEDLYNLAAKNSYVLSDLFGNLYSNVDSWLQCVDRYYWDYLMLPRERAEEFNSLLGPLRHTRLPLF